MEEAKHIVILAAGEFPTHPVPLGALREADAVICCDSAYIGLKAAAPDRAATAVVIGDGDSLSPCEKRRLGDRWLEVGEQDYNDLHKAVSWATTRYPLPTTRFTLLGATGRREDHTLGNISYLVTFAEEHPGIDLEMLTDHGRFTAMSGRRTYPALPRQQVSIFSLTPEAPIHADGLRWPLDGFRARRWWQATLNEAVGTEFSLRTDGWLVVFQTYDPKGPSA